MADARIPPVVWNGRLGRDVRAGTFEEQGTATVELVEAAVRDGASEDAARLARYLLVEMAEPVELFPPFHVRARRHLEQAGVAPEVLEREEARLRMVDRVSDEEADLNSSWERLTAGVEAFAAACEGGGGQQAIGDLVEALRRWQRAHDYACDLVHLHFMICAEHLGEPCVEEMWDALLSDVYPSRDRYDPKRTPWSESVEVAVLDACETFRGHLSGPGRRGTIDVSDEPERIVITFAPCGTGGRAFTADDGELRFGVTTAPHDWSWGRAGVCLYCVHCCQLQERIPIRRFGSPVRVVEPPTWPASAGEGRCTWYVYKDPALVPAEAYARLGESKPETLS